MASLLRSIVAHHGRVQQTGVRGSAKKKPGCRRVRGADGDSGVVFPALLVQSGVPAGDCRTWIRCHMFACPGPGGRGWLPALPNRCFQKKTRRTGRSLKGFQLNRMEPEAIVSPPSSIAKIKVEVPEPARAEMKAPDLLEQLKKIDWFQFERIVALTYRKLGYTV